MSIQSHICRHWFRFTLLANFDFYVCLRINFHASSFWGLILAAGGPYWVLISQKNGSLLGPYLKAWGSFLVLETVLGGLEGLEGLEGIRELEGIRGLRGLRG